VIDPAVTQENLAQTICKSGYASSVRPSTSYTSKVKSERMQAYGDTDSPTHYELDHLVSLELGGSPTNVGNLWPELASPTPGFHEKDKVEDYLHSQVCTGKLDLATAQQEIAQDWTAVLLRIP
jgi:hypothetical protein